jgi:hypothetical protein
MNANNEPDSSSGQPETEANRRIRLDLEKARAGEEFELANAEEEDSEPTGFRSTKLGKRWTAFETRLKKTRLGSFTLGTFYILQIGALIAFLIFWNPLVNALFDLSDPSAYKLSEAQIAEGYDRTCSGSGKGCSLDNVYFRFHTEADQQAGTECREEFAWCVLAIPREEPCEKVTMRVNTFRNEGVLEPAIETITVIKNAPEGATFDPGTVLLLGVIPDKENSEYAAVQEIYCYQK